MNSNTGKI